MLVRHRRRDRAASAVAKVESEAGPDDTRASTRHPSGGCSSGTVHVYQSSEPARSPLSSKGSRRRGPRCPAGHSARHHRSERSAPALRLERVGRDRRLATVGRGRAADRDQQPVGEATCSAAAAVRSRPARPAARAGADPARSARPAPIPRHRPRAASGCPCVPVRLRRPCHVGSRTLRSHRTKSWSSPGSSPVRQKAPVLEGAAVSGWFGSVSALHPAWARVDARGMTASLPTRMSATSRAGATVQPL